MTVAKRVSDQVSMSPSGVALQFVDRIRLAISPDPWIRDFEGIGVDGSPSRDPAGAVSGIGVVIDMDFSRSARIADFDSGGNLVLAHRPCLIENTFLSYAD